MNPSPLALQPTGASRSMVRAPSSTNIAHVVGVALIQAEAAFDLAVPLAARGAPLDLNATRALVDAAAAVREALGAIRKAGH